MGSRVYGFLRLRPTQNVPTDHGLSDSVPGGGRRSAAGPDFDMVRGRTVARATNRWRSRDIEHTP
jgi:hypothetical protein